MGLDEWSQLLGVAVTGDLVPPLVRLLLLLEEVHETLPADCIFPALKLVEEGLSLPMGLIVHRCRLLIICPFFAINY